MHSGEIQAIIEPPKKSLDKSVGIYRMTKSYWEKYIGKTPKKEDNFRVACLGAGDNLEATAFAYAIEGKAESDLTKTLLKPYVSIIEGSKRKLVPYKAPESNITTYSFDYETEQLNTLKQNPFTRRMINKDHFVQADLRKLPVNDGTFDVCVVRNPYWDELEEANGVDQVFAEFNRVLKNDGVLWMTFLSEEEYLQAKDIIEKQQGEDYSITYSGKSDFQTVPGTYTDPTTGQQLPYPWDSYIIIAERA